MPEAYTGQEEIPETLLEFDMIEMGGSGQSGSGTVVQVERKSKVVINITPGSGGLQLADIHRGRCAAKEAQVDFLLFDVVDGQSISVINIPASFFGFNRNIVVVHAGTSESDPVASCGDVPTLFG
ncbi:MAG: hypothetical protein V3U26_02890 [Dehalococcoidia bacterium]